MLKYFGYSVIIDGYNPNFILFAQLVKFDELVKSPIKTVS
jgi:hypothetical protein